MTKSQLATELDALRHQVSQLTTDLEAATARIEKARTAYVALRTQYVESEAHVKRLQIIIGKRCPVTHGNDVIRSALAAAKAQALSSGSVVRVVL